MKTNKKRIVWIALIALLSLAALLLSRFGGVSAGEITGSNQEVHPVVTEDGKPGGLPVKETGNESIIFSLLKLLGALIAVVIAIYGFLYILKLMMGRRLSANKSSSLIEVLETAHLSPKKALSLVRFSDRAVLIGVSDTGLTALAELDAEETAKIISEYAQTKAPSGFKSALKDARARMMFIGRRRVKMAVADH
jgi:flagellar biogenesis protein FliO